MHSLDLLWEIDWIQSFESLPSLREEVECPSKRSAYEVENLKPMLFHGCIPEQVASEENLELILYHLTEFVVGYRLLKGGGTATSNTMRSYLLAIQRQFKYWGYPMDLQKGPVFAHPKHGLAHVMENRFSKQQSQGTFTKARETSKKEQLIKLISFKACQPSTPTGYQTRLIVSYSLERLDHKKAAVRIKPEAETWWERRRMR